MVIEDLDGGGADVAGTTGGALGVVRRAEDVASSVGIAEGATRVGGMISVGILACCAYDGCSSYGGSGGASISRALGGAT